jgi:phosphoenolpyruvate-protein kinase (PTS system EI component)
VRAILRANVHGNLRIMLPMVTSLDELDASREHLLAVCAELGAATPPLGVMIETPAAVAIAQHLATRADFFSIGTNDPMRTRSRPTARTSASPIYDPFHPARWRDPALSTRARAGIPARCAASWRAIRVAPL